MQLPILRTPLGVIALFVTLIEGFLAFPVTQLENAERLIIVIFMTTFPFYVASFFFLMLWLKQENLYSPLEHAQAQKIYRESIRTALDVRHEESFEELRQREQALPFEAAVLGSTDVQQLAPQARHAADSDVDEIEADVRSRMEAAGSTDPAIIQAIKSQVKQTRREREHEIAQTIRERMSEFRDWLGSQGFKDLPDLPQIVIEPRDFMNAYLDVSQNTAHFGLLVGTDPDTIAHTYFHSVIQDRRILERFEGETAALVEGYCDYYACAYNGDPFLGEDFARAAGLKPGWIRDLRKVVRLDQVEPEPHAMSVVWSGACWELRAHYGAEKVDSAVGLILTHLKADSSIRDAAQALADELARATDEGVKAKVQTVFQRRAVEIDA